MIDLVPLIDELSNVKAFFSDLKFVEDTHSYFVDGKRLKYSVSGLIKKFVPYTDWDGVAEKVAERTKIEKEVIQQEWKETADIACEEGTETHLFGEEYPINRKLKGDTQLKKAVEKFWNELPSHIIPLNMELKMYHKIFKFAGTMDLLLYNTKTKKLFIADYKTNKDLFKNFQGQEMLAPFRDKLDNPFNHYVIQLSFYQILLKQICKLEIAGRKIIYLRRDGNYDIYNVPDVTNLLSLELDKNYDKWHQQAS